MTDHEYFKVEQNRIPEKSDWVIRYDPPNTINEDGSQTINCSFPALIVAEWVADKEKTANQCARALNNYDSLLEALEECADQLASLGMYPVELKARAAIAKAKEADE